MYSAFHFLITNANYFLFRYLNKRSLSILGFVLKLILDYCILYDKFRNILNTCKDEIAAGGEHFVAER